MVKIHEIMEDKVTLNGHSSKKVKSKSKKLSNGIPPIPTPKTAIKNDIKPKRKKDIGVDSSAGSDNGVAPTKKRKKTVKLGLSTNYIDKANETLEDKLRRKKLERQKRKMGKNIRNGNPGMLSRKLRHRMEKIWGLECEFVVKTLQALPEVRQPHLYEEEEEKMEDYLLDEDISVSKVDKRREEFMNKMRRGKEETTRALTHEELKKRLHDKLELLGQKRNEKKKAQKLKKIARQKESGDGEETASTDKKKKFISKANPNLKNQHKGQQSSSNSIKDEKPLQESSINGQDQQPKTPLRKRPVVKSNGEVVYSKFDFISADQREGALFMKRGKGKPKPTELLKTVQQNESKIARLETEGKSEEAASFAESKKWDSALKRSQGEKIRDDPTLLKKTIKKQDKLKQVSKKKWAERTDRVEKQKEARQDKRKSNIQTRKDDKQKKVKKHLRKQGRIA